jgi:hypothetical protein
MTTATKTDTRFRALTTLLHRHENLWRPVPFYLSELPWESNIPELATALRKLDQLQLSELESDSAALLTWLGEFIPEMGDIAALQRVPLQSTAAHHYSSRFHRDIPGRKWRQIKAFAGCMKQPDGRILEWCSGKGHLGRALHQRFRVPVTGLDWNSDLCRKGNKLSHTHNVDVRLEHCDVLSPAAAHHLGQAKHAVALHACGDLHRRLIETASSRGIQSLHLSPCCYHLSADTRYRPFSRAGRNSGLQLSRDECRLAVQETVTAAATTAKRRDKKNAWRLGFDRLQRKIRGVDEYLPVPPVSDLCLKAGFADFCHQAAAMKALAIPQGVDWSALEQIGWQRQAEVCRMELPRHAFRRVLELWLVLDRALYLEESGYSVRVSRFCERDVTPRNLLIRAFKPVAL